jgi:uncharacterized protein (DUF58 family)
MLLAGVAVVTVSIFASQQDVLRIGLLLTALPLIALILVATARLRLRSERAVVPERVQLGSPMVGWIRLGLEGRLPVGVLMLTDQVPLELGTPPRFTIDRPGVNWRREIEYPLLGRVRGRWRCGPLSVRTTDPFGLVQLEQKFSATSEVLVTPQIVELTPLSAGGGSGSNGEAQPHRIGTIGADDVLIREYRHGDDVRRVHWRSTARRGDLMVRREEQAWDPRARVILDSRAGAHAGSGIYSSLEWAVSAVASIGLRFINDGYALEVYEADGPLGLGAAGTNRSTAGDLLVSRLTDLRPRRILSFRYGLEAAAADRTGDLVVAVMGRLTTDDARGLLRTRHPRAQGVVFLLDTDTYQSEATNGSAASLFATADGRVRPDDDLTAVADLLRAEGWRVVRVRRPMTVAEAWAAVDAAARPKAAL